MPGASQDLLTSPTGTDLTSPPSPLRYAERGDCETVRPSSSYSANMLRMGWLLALLVAGDDTAR
jgi:hypothetical protein